MAKGESQTESMPCVEAGLARLAEEWGGVFDNDGKYNVANTTHV